MTTADGLLAGWGVRRAVLSTHDAHGLYAGFGFAPLERPDHWMARSYADPDPAG